MVKRIRKAIGPCDIPVEVWKSLKEAAAQFLTRMFLSVKEALQDMSEALEQRRGVLWVLQRSSKWRQDCKRDRL